MKGLLVLAASGYVNSQKIAKELKELAFAADVLFKNDKFISQEVDIVSREGPSGTGKGKGKKNKKGKNPEGEGEPNERGFKTASLQDAIETWQYKYKDAQEETGKLSKKELKELISEGRILNFKSLVSEVLPDEFFQAEAEDTGPLGMDKFMDYGCYCLPLGNDSISNLVGKGKPVDAIDQLCHDLWNCYRCSKVDQGKQCDGQNNYDWYVKVTGRIKCGDKDHNDSCQSQVCNCDMQFSSRLKLLVSTWQPNFHKTNGFSRKKQCLGVTDKLGAKTNQESDDESRQRPPGNPSQCCGTGIQRSPFKPDRFECCKDGRVEIIGEC